MDRSKEVEEKSRKLSAKLGALFVKELLIKQYKLNYLQKLRAESQAFNTWKKAYISTSHKKKGMYLIMRLFISSDFCEISK